MSDIFKLFSGMVEGDLIARIEPEDNNGLGVSTVVTVDMGPETAILDNAGAHPVERYATVDLAKVGHDKWVRRSKTLTTVTKLGYGDLIDPKVIKLRRAQ